MPAGSVTLSDWPSAVPTLPVIEPPGTVGAAGVAASGAAVPLSVASSCAALGVPRPVASSNPVPARQVAQDPLVPSTTSARFAA